MVKSDYMKWRGLVNSVLGAGKRKHREREHPSSSMRIEFLINKKVIHIQNLTSKLTYEKLINKSTFRQAPSRLKYDSMYYISNKEWKKIYSISNICTYDRQLQEFQYKILHRYLALNPLLKKMGISDTDLCFFCNNDIETIPHIFWNCKIISNFWEIFSIWWKQNTKADITLTEEIILFGYLENTDIAQILNLLILIGKRHIYCTKLSNITLSFEMYVKKLQWYFKIEKQIALSNTKSSKFKKKWETISHIFC